MHILHTHTQSLAQKWGRLPTLSGARRLGRRQHEALTQFRCTAPKPRNVQYACAHHTLSCEHKGGLGALPDWDAFTRQVKALIEPVERTRSLNFDFLVKAALHPTLQYQAGKYIRSGSCWERKKGWRKLLFGAYECLFLLRRIFQFGHRT